MLLRSSKGRSVLVFLFVLAAVQVIFHVASLEPAFADSLVNAPEIFDVRISLPLEPEDPSYHDFYINAGPEAGFKKGMYVTAVRLIPVHDPIQNKQQATLTVNVARLQVIYVERNLTIARLDSEFTDEERPTLEFESVMIGDRIDPASLTMEAPKSKQKTRKKIASRPALIERDAEQASSTANVTGTKPAPPTPASAGAGGQAAVAPPSGALGAAAGPATSTSNVPAPGASAKAI